MGDGDRTWPIDLSQSYAAWGRFVDAVMTDSEPKPRPTINALIAEVATEVGPTLFAEMTNRLNEGRSPMLVRIAINLAGIDFDEQFRGDTADAIFHAFREEAQKRMPWGKRLYMRNLPDLQFMADVVDAHNDACAASEPYAQSADEFLAFGVRCGYVTIIDGPGPVPQSPGAAA